MHFFKTSQVSIHAVFARHLCTLWEVIYFLVPCERLISLALDVRASPRDKPFLISIADLSEAIVFKCVSDQGHIDIVIKFEIIAFVRWFVRAKSHRVNIWPED